MKLPKYTTRIFLGYMTLAMIAATLGVGSIHRIKTSLAKFQKSIVKYDRQISASLRLHETFEDRRQAKRLFLETRDYSHIEAWLRANSRLVDQFAAVRNLEENAANKQRLTRIVALNRKIEADWQALLETHKRGGASPPDDISVSNEDQMDRLIGEFITSKRDQARVAHRAAAAAPDETLRAVINVSALVFFLALVLALYVSSTMQKALSKLLEATEKITRGHLGHRLDINRTDEIGTLSEAFDEMSQALHHKDEQIRAQLRKLVEAHDRQEAYSRELELKNKEMESFIYMVSHDLKAPLIAIQGFLAMFAAEFNSKLSEQALFYLSRVQANGEQMQTLIQQLLELSRASLIDHQFTTVDMREIVEKILEELRVQIEFTKAKIAVDQDWPVITCEPGRVKQALANLVDNALHYRHPDRPLEITIGIGEDDDVWRFFVKDNGIGIEPEYQQKIFDVFERLSDAQKQNANGTGIGLAIVRRIAENHGGGVRVASKLNTGSIFYLEVSKHLSPHDARKLEVEA